MDEFLFTEPIPEPEYTTVEIDGFQYEKRKSTGCVSLLLTGIIIPEVLDEQGEIITEKRIEPITAETAEIIPSIEERVGNLETGMDEIVTVLEGVV